MDRQATGTPQGSAGGARPGPLQRVLKSIRDVHPATVFFLVALSLGLAGVAVQMYYLPLLVVFAVVWGVTVVALMGTMSRWISNSQRHGHHGGVAAAGH
jgi:hypothetical protein